MRSRPCTRRHIRSRNHPPCRSARYRAAATESASSDHAPLRTPDRATCRRRCPNLRSASGAPASGRWRSTGNGRRQLPQRTTLRPHGSSCCRRWSDSCGTVRAARGSSPSDRSCARQSPETTCAPSDQPACCLPTRAQSRWPRVASGRSACRPRLRSTRSPPAPWHRGTEARCSPPSLSAQCGAAGISWR